MKIRRIVAGAVFPEALRMNDELGGRTRLSVLNVIHGGIEPLQCPEMDRVKSHCLFFMGGKASGRKG